MTLKYSAPEVIGWESRNASSDIFSLGCIYIEILAILTPALIPPDVFEGCSSDNIEILQDLLREAFLCADLSSEIKPILDPCARMLQRKREDRITAKELRARYYESDMPPERKMKVVCDACRLALIPSGSKRLSD